MFAGRASWGLLSIVVLCAVVTASLVSCDYFVPQEVPLLPPEIPGAEYVGMQVCAGCHTDEAREFRGAPHATVAVREADDEEVYSGEGCESCHGPGSLHVEARGNKTKIVKGDWNTCVRCHSDVGMRLRMRYRHPVAEGRMSCSSCHDPHKGMRAVREVEQINETCFGCHPDKKGPWTFTHEAVTEDGCTVCHNPHGTNVEKMLVADGLVLCLRCHVQANHPRIGTSNHRNRLPEGGCASLGCHTAVHGSNFSQHLRTE